MNLYGPVRVADTAGSGSATITLSFDNWKGAKVAPTTHTVQVLPAKRGPKSEPVSGELGATLPHPDRKASVWTVAYSADGKKLFASGYPSGVIQVFDVAARKELRRIETPPGYRGSAEYALVTPDFKTVYVPADARKLLTVERDGKPVKRVEYSGRVRVWNLETGEEGPSLDPPAGFAPVYAKLSPDGKHLVCVERPGFDTDADPRPKDVTVVWNLATRERRKLSEGFQVPKFAPDGKTLFMQETDYDAKTSVVRVLDFATFKEVAKLACPEKDRNFSLEGVSPDGALLAVGLGGKKGAPRELWLRDAKTLEDRGRFVTDGEPDRYGWGTSAFSPDGKTCVILGLPGTAQVWDVAAKKVVRTVELPGGSGWNLAFAPDGRSVAVPWMAKYEETRERDPDPRDFPQPRVTVFELAGDKPPRTFVAPHGFVGAVAFAPGSQVLAFGSSGGVHLFELSK